MTDTQFVQIHSSNQSGAGNYGRRRGQRAAVLWRKDLGNSVVTSIIHDFYAPTAFRRVMVLFIIKCQCISEPKVVAVMNWYFILYFFVLLFE